MCNYEKIKFKTKLGHVGNKCWRRRRKRRGKGGVSDKRGGGRGVLFIYFNYKLFFSLEHFQIH